MKILFALILSFSFSAFALEVDEKLTVRILRTSETKKTVMINRGTEDGLVEGDHAKFIVTAGIVARGVLVKLSPTRSVWSIYRLVNADFITTDAVMSIKITPPVKITKDESQALVQEDTPTSVAVGDPSQLGIPLADGAQDLNQLEAATGTSQSDLKALQDTEPSVIPEKNWEIFGLLNISGLTANTKTDNGSDSFNNSQSYHHIGLGAELYPQKERNWYSKFSLQGNVNVMRINSQAYSGASATNDVTEFEAGLNWHPTKLPSVTMQFIPYLHAGIGMGSVKSSYKNGKETNGAKVEGDATGSTSSYSFGVGYKFYTYHGFGVRALLDYYYRSEKYDDDSNSSATPVRFNKKVGGPRFMVGLSYRF